jgi:hypothetical protein
MGELLGDGCGLYRWIRGCLAAAVEVCGPDVVFRVDLSLAFFKTVKLGDDSTKDRTGIGSHPPNRISVGGYHEVEMRACLDGRGGAIRVDGVGASDDHRHINLAVQACCIDGVAVAFSIVGYLSNRGDWSQADNRTPSGHGVGTVKGRIAKWSGAACSDCGPRANSMATSAAAKVQDTGSLDIMELPPI